MLPSEFIVELSKTLWGIVVVLCQLGMIAALVAIIILAIAFTYYGIRLIRNYFYYIDKRR